MNILEAIFLGIVQGLTEFLPVSSSGHLTLLGKILRIDPASLYTFTTLVHGGTLIAVVLIMRKDLLAVLKNLKGSLTIRLVIATIPAVVAAVLFGGLIESLFGGRTLGYEFLATGVILLVTILFKSQAESDSDKDIGNREALLAGIGQAVAITPAISRSGATLAALLLSGVSREKAIRFSFLMSVPAILGSLVLDLKDLFSAASPAPFSLSPISTILGIAAAAVSGYLAMNFMIRKLNDRGFLYCATYVIVLGTLILLDQNWFHLVF